VSNLLNIGASGAHAYQAALTAIGENVANATTPGYTRRSVTLAQAGGAASTSLYYNNNAGFAGVAVTNVTRAWNDYQAASSRTAMSSAGRADSRLTWLTNAQTAMDDGTSGVGQSAASVFNAGDTLAGDPSNTSNRKAFLSALDQTASAFRDTAASLKSTSQGIATAAQTTVQSVNADLDSLAKVNAALLATRSGTSGQADLLDQRDRLLDNLSGNIGIDVSVSADGSATVRLAQGGLQLIGGTGAGTDSGRLTLGVASDGRLSVQAVVNGGSQAVGDAGGALGGLAESASVVADRRNALDSLANDFKASINSFQAAGTDANGATGVALLSGTGAAGLTLATTDPTKVAAASSAGANGNLLTISSLRGTNGVEARWNAMVTDQGQLVSSATSEDSAASARRDASVSARDQTSGVDLDTEAADLIRYQQAYSGAAKVIQVAKDTLQSIIDLF
jgi:flagellar hook-associated protein 1 FlgK